MEYFVLAAIGVVGLACGFLAGWKFRKHQVRAAEKARDEATWDRDILRSRLVNACASRDRALVQYEATDLVIDRILDVIHDAREKQAKVSEALCAEGAARCKAAFRTAAEASTSGQ